MFPKAENVSYMALLSIVLSKFLIKMLPTPERRRDGSRCDHMMRIGLPLSTSKFIVSRALSAVQSNNKNQNGTIEQDSLRLTISRLLEIDVGVAEGTASDHVSADPDGHHRPRCRKLLKKHRLGNLIVEVSNVQRRNRIIGSGIIHFLTKSAIEISKVKNLQQFQDMTRGQRQSKHTQKYKTRSNMTSLLTQQSGEERKKRAHLAELSRSQLQNSGCHVGRENLTEANGVVAGKKVTDVMESTRLVNSPEGRSNLEKLFQ